MSKYRIMILGASYGSLLASKILFGGHSVRLVCLPEEADLINAEGFRVRLPVRGRAEPVELDSRRLPGTVSASGAKDVDPSEYDLIGLNAGAPIRIARRSRVARYDRLVSRSMHVHHEHAAACLHEKNSRC